MTSPVSARLIVVPIIKDDSGRVLLCKMPADRGVFPGQWGLPGGGVEAGEHIEDALRREVFEELGVSLLTARPVMFKDGQYEKTFPGEGRREIYMVFLLYECQIAENEVIRLNPEFCEYAWVDRSSLASYDLNVATRETFTALGLL